MSRSAKPCHSNRESQLLDLPVAACRGQARKTASPEHDQLVSPPPVRPCKVKRMVSSEANKVTQLTDRQREARFYAAVAGERVKVYLLRADSWNLVESSAEERDMWLTSDRGGPKTDSSSSKTSAAINMPGG